MLLRKLLLPTDLSPEGERAFPAVAELARTLRAKVVLLHVVENPGVAPLGPGRKPPRVLPGTEPEVARAKAELEQRRKAFADVELVLDVVVAPSVPHALADYADQEGCDAILLSSHGRSGFRRLVMGSVAGAVLRAARVPVMVFPRQE